MRVFCRFAPAAPSAAEAAEGRAAGPSLAEAALLLRTESATPPSAAAPPPTNGPTRVHLADPATFSRASFACDGVFLPPPTAADPAHATWSSQQQQQLYDTTCRRVLQPTAARAGTVAPPLRTYLAYGQTASGKTFSLFGEATALAASSVPGRGVQLASSAGVVPRFLQDVLGAACADAFVDVACFEVYNEVTTDLVALAASIAVPGGASAAAAAHTLSSSSSAMRVRGASCRSSSALRRSGSGGDGGGGGGSAEMSMLQRQQRPVWVAHQLYRSEQQLYPDDAAAPYARDDGWATRSDTTVSELTGCTGSVTGPAPSLDASLPPPHLLKVEYKSTEKQQVFRCLERARCTTLSDALAVLQALLALRQECTTSRNQSSSRGHLVLCVRVYSCSASARNADRASGPAAPPLDAVDGEEGEDGEWVLQHETAFVDLAGSENGRLTDVDVDSEHAVAAVAAAHTRRTARSRVNHCVAASVRGSSAHSRASLDTSVQSGASSQRSGRNSSGNDGGDRGGTGSAPTAALVTTTGSAYHRALLLPQPQEADVKAARARRLRETRCINASLLALRKVFRALHEATQQLRHASSSAHGEAGGGLPRRPPLHHAPFKDSALTAILEPFLVPQPPPAPAGRATALQGRTNVVEPPPPSAAEAHVVLLVCCSSRSSDFSETVASLRLGAEATAVNPEVVLRALPVQQREMERNARAAAAQHPTRAPALVLRRRADRAPSAFHRSASAPVRQRALTARNDASGMSSFGPANALAHRSGAPGECTCGAQRRAAAPQSEAAAGAEGVDEVVKLREEAQRYKATAQQLYTQCKSLCESYDECVAELGRCRAALAERDARVAELEAELQRRTQPVVGLPEPTHLRTTSAATAAAPDGRGTSPTARAPVQLPSSTRVSSAVTAAMTAAARLRTASRSAAREGSGRWVVSVSPFSAASAVRPATGAEARADSRGSGTVEDDEGLCSAAAEEAVRAACSTGPATASRLRAHSPVVEPQEEGAMERVRQRQQAHARSIMHTLLARQIFPATAPLKTAEAVTQSAFSLLSLSSSPSPSPPRSRHGRGGSPSPMLPALSACASAAATTTKPRGALGAESASRSASSSEGRTAGRRGPFTRAPCQGPDTHGGDDADAPRPAATAAHCRRSTAAAASSPSPSSAGATASRSVEDTRRTASPPCAFADCVDEAADAVSSGGSLADVRQSGQGAEREKTGGCGDARPAPHRTCRTAAPQDGREAESDDDVVTVVAARPCGVAAPAVEVPTAEALTQVDGAESGGALLQGPHPLLPVTPVVATAEEFAVQPAARVRAPLMPPCRSPSVSLIASSAPATPMSSQSLLVYQL